MSFRTNQYVKIIVLRFRNSGKEQIEICSCMSIRCRFRFLSPRFTQQQSMIIVNIFPRESYDVMFKQNPTKPVKIYTNNTRTVCSPRVIGRI